MSNNLEELVERMKIHSKHLHAVDDLMDDDTNVFTYENVKVEKMPGGWDYQVTYPDGSIVSYDMHVVAGRVADYLMKRRNEK